MNQESLIDILMYVFENYIDDPAFAKKYNGKQIVTEMLKDGFKANEIDRALVWFGELNELQSNVSREYKKISAQAIRVFTAYEAARITLEARQYLLQLEQLKIIDPVSREVILDRVMALNEVIIGLADLKWVALLVLHNQPERHNELCSLEELIMLGESGTKH